MSWQQYYQSRQATADEAVREISSGNRVVLGHACAEPEILVSAMLDRAAELRDVEIVNMLATTTADYSLPEYRQSFHLNTIFAGRSTRRAVNEGGADFTPCFFHQVPQLFREHILPVDVALIMVSPPDNHGLVSLGTSVDYTRQAALSAQTVIAQVTPQMPRTGGESFLHVEDIDHFVACNQGPIEIAPVPIGETELEIGREVAALIRDGDCLQFGIGAIPDAVLSFLSDKHDLGIHSELLGDAIMPLVEGGVVTGRYKGFQPEKIVFNLAMGTRAFYDWLDDHPQVAMYPVDITNDPMIIAQNDNMVTINSAITVDLLGQVAADTIGPRQYSGVGGQVDFVRGAAHSKGGRNVIALPATAAGGKVSRIVTALERGQAVTTSRHDVDYLATEFGLVRLKGLTTRQRSQALIDIAAPQFRDDLRRDCRDLYGW